MGPAAHVSPVGSGLQAVVDGTWVVLSDAAIRREWQVTAGPLGGYATTHLVDSSTGRDWAAAPSPDFQLTVDGVSLSSSTGWAVGVSTRTQPRAASVTFNLTSPVGLEVTRTYTLHPGSATIEVASTLS